MNLSLSYSEGKQAKAEGGTTSLVYYKNTTNTHLSFSVNKFLPYVVRKWFETLKMAELMWIGIGRKIIHNIDVLTNLQL